MARPSVCIAMPVRNCEATIEPAIRSILAQTYPHWSLVLLDDGSTDRTVAVARRYSIDERVQILVDGRSLGITARLNQAIASSASAKYFARMDGDDICYPERLERQVTTLEADPRIDVLGASILVFGPSGEGLGWRPGPPTHEEICARPNSGFKMAHPTWCGRRAWFERYGYDKRAFGCEDQDLLRRAWRESRFSNLPEILLGYREHGIRLAATLRTRTNTVRSVARTEGGWIGPVTLRSGFEQAVKSIAEVAAWIPGKDEIVLRRRRDPLRYADRVRWAEIWRLNRE
jgi:glycosyltransferase involved in cell wall biosynthesis